MLRVLSLSLEERSEVEQMLSRAEMKAEMRSHSGGQGLGPRAALEEATLLTPPQEERSHPPSRPKPSLPERELPPLPSEGSKGRTRGGGRRGRRGTSPTTVTRLLLPMKSKQFAPQTQLERFLSSLPVSQPLSLDSLDGSSRFARGRL